MTSAISESSRFKAPLRNGQQTIFVSDEWQATTNPLNGFHEMAGLVSSPGDD
jgi:hypothetical protein